MSEPRKPNPEESFSVQTFQMLASTAASLNTPTPPMVYLQLLMGRPFPSTADGSETRERLEWMLEAEARYRLKLAQKILDIAQAEHK
ncbi:hypothetical protein [Pseudomonas sp. FSL W5-0299]|jgi:hypothetical protein|uniref:hypothetical protein n=1 Tax=Pseudomonas sp. FSL W5-0299 TaxID=1917484 RepID=UPI00098A0FB8|nr:hypothetical protein [Pseudomonas sp. FSL W5-0299]